MEFGWINLAGGIIVMLMMVPNIIFSIKSAQGQVPAKAKLQPQDGVQEKVRAQAELQARSQTQTQGRTQTQVPAEGEAEARATHSRKFMEILEQVGRYACIVLIWLPLFVWKFGFGSVAGLVAYVLLNGALLVAYYAIWPAYMKSPTRARAVALAVIPTLIFFASGVLLRHWALVVAAALFGVSHLYVTLATHKA